MFDSFFQAVLCSGSRKTETAVEDLTPKAAPRRFKYPANLINEEDSSDTTSQNKKYLVLDLDETLIHTRDTPFEKDIPSLHFRTSKSQNKFYVAIRPHLIEFLEEMSQLYTIVIFTAASKDYAEAVIKRLKIGKYIETLFHREDCTSTWTGLTKNLAILGVPLKDVILVDDLIDNSRYQPDNFLLIHSFQGQKNDQALTKLIPFLKELAGVADVRNVDERYNKYYERLKMAEGLKKVADDVAAQMEKPESSKNEDPKEPVSPGLSDNEPVSGSIVSPPTSLSSLDVKPQGSLLMRTARGFYASLIRVPA